MTYDQVKKLRDLKANEYYVMYWIDNKRVIAKTKDKHCILVWAHAIKDNEYNVLIK